MTFLPCLLRWGAEGCLPLAVGYSGFTKHFPQMNVSESTSRYKLVYNIAAKFTRAENVNIFFIVEFYFKTENRVYLLVILNKSGMRVYSPVPEEKSPILQETADGFC